MTEHNAQNSHVLQNSNSKTVSLTFHLYPRHYKEFIEICEKLEKFHSEILRELVIDFINKHKQQPQRQESNLEQQPQKKESQEESEALETYLRKLAGDRPFD